MSIAVTLWDKIDLLNKYGDIAYGVFTLTQG